jgi:hypothetical protein
MEFRPWIPIFRHIQILSGFKFFFRHGEKRISFINILVQYFNFLPILPIGELGSFAFKYKIPLNRLTVQFRFDLVIIP